MGDTWAPAELQKSMKVSSRLIRKLSLKKKQNIPFIGQNICK